MIGVVFGEFDMQSSGVTVTDTNIYSAPQNRIQADALAETDGALIVKQQYQPKTFTVDGILRADTIALFESLLDGFKVAMSRKNQGLDIDYAGGTRRWLASYQNMVITKRGNTSARFSVELLSPDGMGWNVTESTLVAATTVTAASQVLDVSVDGSYKTEPLIAVTVTSLTGGTAKTVSLANSTTLRGISITRTWAANNVLEVDSLKKTVFVNNAPVEFTGQFPEFEPGGAGVSYIDDFTTRSVSVSATYTKRWL